MQRASMVSLEHAALTWSLQVCGGMVTKGAVILHYDMNFEWGKIHQAISEWVLPDVTSSKCRRNINNCRWETTKSSFPGLKWYLLYPDWLKWYLLYYTQIDAYCTWVFQIWTKWNFVCLLINFRRREIMTIMNNYCRIVFCINFVEITLFKIQNLIK